MNKTKKKLTKSALIVFVIYFSFVITGCKSRVEDVLDDMKKPVYIAAIGTSGDILLRDSNGHVLQLPAEYYMARTIAGSELKAGDILIPATDNEE
jgi:hypothetical protein